MNQRFAVRPTSSITQIFQQLLVAIKVIKTNIKLKLRSFSGSRRRRTKTPNPRSSEPRKFPIRSGGRWRSSGGIPPCASPQPLLRPPAKPSPRPSCTPSTAILHKRANTWWRRRERARTWLACGRRARRTPPRVRSCFPPKCIGCAGSRRRRKPRCCRI